MVNLMSAKAGSVHELEVDGAVMDTEPLLPTPVTSKTHDDHYWTYVRVFAIIWLVNIAFQILQPAQTQIFEDIYCRQYYENSGRGPLPGLGLKQGRLPEELCKAGAVQKQVSSLKGWLEFYDAMPGLVMAIPIGILSDLFGRRPFFNLCFFVLAVQQAWITIVTLMPDTIPLEAIWWKGLLNFLSGGIITAEMLFAVMVTDITPQEQMSNVFFMAGAVGSSTSVIGPIIAAALMEYNAWWAVWIGLGCLVAILPLVITSPETLRRHHDYQRLDEEPGAAPSRLQTAFRLIVSAFRELGLVWTDWRLVFLVLLYPFRMMGNALGDLLIRYVSNRYNWTLADATFLYSIQAASATLVLFFLLPWFADLLERRYNLSAVQKNVALSRLALFTLALAYLIEGFAPRVWVLLVGLLIQTLASGSPGALRALAGCMVESKDNGRVFCVLAISETLSNMMAFPATAWLFNKAIEKGDVAWLGLPFYVTSVMALLAAGTMCLLRFERRGGSSGG